MGDITNREVGVILFGVLATFPWTYAIAYDAPSPITMLAGLATVPWFIVTAPPAAIVTSCLTGNVKWPLLFRKFIVTINSK